MPIHNTHVHTGDSAHCTLSVRKFAVQRIRKLSIKFRHFRSIKPCLEIADTMNLGSGVLAKGVELSALTDPCNFPSPSSEAVPPSSAPIWRNSPLLLFPAKYRRREARGCGIGGSHERTYSSSEPTLHSDEFENTRMEVLQARQAAADDSVMDRMRLRAAALSCESSTQVRPIRFIKSSATAEGS